MPHLIVEHSSNVAEVADIGGLVAALHLAALGTGIAPVDALRTRAASREHCAIGDQHPDNKFVAVTARLGAGRSDDDKHTLIHALVDALDEFLGDAKQLMMLSVEYQEIDPDWRVNVNHLRPAIIERANPIDPARRG